jgi:hypothetical protein
MLTQSYLFNPHGTDHSLAVHSTRLIPEALQSLRLVVPRSSCVYARVSCAGVPRFGLRGFAQLQVEQLSPFQKFGSFAVKQSETLHLWMWDKSVEIAFAEKHGDRKAKTVLPQSLLGQPRDQGVSWLQHRGQAGLEGQLWRTGKLVDSLYFETPPSASHWTTTLARQPELGVIGWPAILPPTPAVTNHNFNAKAWGTSLLRPAFRLPQIQGALIARIALWMATAALGAGTAAVLSERSAHQKAIADGAESQKQRIVSLEPIQQARDAAQEIERWLASAQTLSPRPSKLAILNEVATVVNQQGLLVRDLELTPPTLSAMLVSANGADIRLTAVIGAIEANPLFTDARFVDIVGGNAFKFTWRLRGAMPTATSAAPTSGVRP